jgi:hypothetical protein
MRSSVQARLVGGLMVAGLCLGAAAEAEVIQIHASGRTSKGAIEISCDGNLCRQTGDSASLGQGCKIECPSGSTAIAVCTTYGDEGRDAVALTSDNVDLKAEGDSNTLYSTFTVNATVAVTCSYKS